MKQSTVMDPVEQHILESINNVLKEPRVSEYIDGVADRVERGFESSKELLAWEAVPLEIYENRLPAEIRSSWVFLLKEGSASGAERHPNSHQRVRSWRREGDLQIWVNDQWKSHFLRNGFDAPLDEQWASIPVNTWHQAIVDHGYHWIVVSFHTAGANDLIEERPDANDPAGVRHRTYAEAQSQMRSPLKK